MAPVLHSGGWHPRTLTCGPGGKLESDLFVPPHSNESEQAILGALLISPEAFDLIADTIREEHFYRYDHRLIFRAIFHLSERSHAVDVITVFDLLSSQGKIEESGGLPYLNELFQSVPSAANVKRHAEIIYEKWQLRSLLSYTREIEDIVMSRTHGKTAPELIAEAGARLAALEDRSRDGDVIDLQAVLVQVIEEIDELYHNPESNHLTGTSYGFLDLDSRTAGMQPGELIVIAGRPSMGKTTLALQIATEVAIEGLPVYVWSGESSAKQMARKMLGNIGKLNGAAIKDGRMTEDDWPRLTNAIQKMQEGRLAFDQRAGLHISQLRAKAKSLKRKYGSLGLVVVDYIQLLQGTGDNRTGEVGSITRGLKLLARELECPVIALSQLSRKVEERANRRPILSDLRESGEIEQDADVVLMIYRDDYYNLDSQDRGLAEINLAKVREGQTGLVRLVFQGEFSRFENLSRDYIPPTTSSLVPKRLSKKLEDR